MHTDKTFRQPDRGALVKGRTRSHRNWRGYSDVTISMQIHIGDLYTKLVLTAIALLLGVIAFRPLADPSAAHAQSAGSDYYIEPRVTTLRKPDGTYQVQGKVVIDMRSGDVWGFPTLEDVPYPVDRIATKPPVSEPIYLGKFDFTKMKSAR